MSALPEEVSSYRQIAIDSAAEIMKCLTETPTNAGVSALPELPDASRVAFEAAYRQIHPCPALSQDYKGIYFEFSTELAWKTWQASRKQALEEAAKVCINKSKEFGQMDGYKRESDAAHECGKLIGRIK